MVVADPKIIVALDVQDNAQLQQIISELNPKLCRVKVGKTLFTQYGPALIQSLHSLGFEVFLDLKFHDIPQQVAGACQQVAHLGVWMTNVHALGGKAMLRKAVDAVKQHFDHTGKRPLLIGVTMLTSLNSDDLNQLGFHGTVEDNVLRLATLCYDAGLDGVVCSAQEAALLKEKLSPDFLCVTPGIRLPADSQDDQQRITTPQQAIAFGSDYLVIGRPITHAMQPRNVLQHIQQSIEVL